MKIDENAVKTVMTGCYICHTSVIASTNHRKYFVHHLEVVRGVFEHLGIFNNTFCTFVHVCISAKSEKNDDRFETCPNLSQT